MQLATILPNHSPFLFGKGTASTYLSWCFHHHNDLQVFIFSPRFASNLLTKKLNLENVRFGKMRLGYDEKRNLLLLADFEKAVAHDILEKISAVKLPREVKVLETLTLPSLYEDHSGGGGYDRDSGKYDQDRNRRTRENYSRRDSGSGKSWSRRPY
jgi:hypothetical protein